MAASASAGTHLIVPPHQSSRLNLAIMQHRIQAKLDLSDPGAEGRAVSAMTARSTASVGSRTATGSNGGYATPLTTQQTPSATSRSCEKKDVEHGVVPGLDKDPSEYVFEDSLDPLPTYASQAYTPAPQYQLTPSDHCEAAPAPIFGRDEAARLHIENEVFETLQRQNRQHNPPSYLEATAHDAELERRRAAKPCDAWARLHGDVGVSWAGRGGRPGRPGRSTRSSRPSRQRRAAGTAALEPPVPSRQSRKREILAEDMRCERYFWVPDAPGYFRPMPCTRYSKGGEKDKDKDKGWLRRRLGRSGWTVQPQQRPADGGARSGGRRRSMSPYPRGGGKSAPSPLSPSRREAAAASRGGSRGRDEGEAVVSTREVGEGSPGIRRSDR
ncbi:hypothetical protein KEM52_001459 [Ascosphaera acerosa]|nr:hypothetical protein KEM52_001459 [Ascosphaera acerosa]